MLKKIDEKYFTRGNRHEVDPYIKLKKSQGFICKRIYSLYGVAVYLYREVSA